MQTFTDLYRYRFVLTNLVSKNLKVLYRNMALGLSWSLLNPLVMVTTLAVIWTTVFEAPPTFTTMVIVVLIPYNFFCYCLTGCVNSIPGNAALVKKVGFPRQILPISVICTHLIHFAIQSTLVVLAIILLPIEATSFFGWHLLWLAPLFVVHLGLCVAVGLLVASLNVLYRDVQYIIESMLNVLFWVCPILYESPKNPFYFSVFDPTPHIHFYALLYYVNPLAGVLSGYRNILWAGKAPDAYSLVMATAITLVLGVIGVWTFWRYEREFADLI